MVHLIENGGNYGWSIKEGFHPFQPQRRQRPDPAGPIRPPIVEYPHAPTRDRPDSGLSITGGYVYRGKKIPELVGVYVYGDFDTGRIWGLRYENGKVVANGELIDVTPQTQAEHRLLRRGRRGRALHPGVRRPDPRAGAAVHGRGASTRRPVNQSRPVDRVECPERNSRHRSSGSSSPTEMRTMPAVIP